MIQVSSNYCRYVLVTPELRRWGLGVTASGKTSIPAGTHYPLGQHPPDHHMDWEQGRVLDALQVVLILKGAGWLETQATGMQRVEAGMVFLLLPKIWHRYRPDPECGWTESWLEAQGPVVESLLADDVFPEKSVLFDGGIAAGLEEQLESIHRILMHGPPDQPALLAADALRVLALCASLPSLHPVGRHIDQAVRQAVKILTERHAEALNIEALAQELGLAYSHFRRSFKTITGFSPWQYVLQVRLTRARRLLSSSNATLDDIAERVGFSSGFHFSNAFKQAYGTSPSHWRRKWVVRPTMK